MKFVIFLITSVIITGITLNAYGESFDEMHDSALEYMDTQNFVQAGESLGGRVSEAGRQLCAGWTKQFSDF